MPLPSLITVFTCSITPPAVCQEDTSSRLSFACLNPNDRKLSNISGSCIEFLYFRNVKSIDGFVIVLLLSSITRLATIRCTTLVVEYAVFVVSFFVYFFRCIDARFRYLSVLLWTFINNLVYQPVLYCLIGCHKIVTFYISINFFKCLSFTIVFYIDFS